MSKKDKSLVKLDSGREVKLKEMSIDDVDYCNDLAIVKYEDGEPAYVTGMSKARTAWLRRGIAGGSFNNFELNGKNLISDKTLKELSDSEKVDLCLKIQDYQQLGE